MSSEQETDNPFIILGHIYPDTMRIFSRRVGMSFSRINMLHEIWHAGEISQKELQDRLDMEGSLMTRFAKQMEADGLITRRTDPKDNRYTLVSLAPAGHEAVEKMDKLGDEFQETLLKGLSQDDQDALMRALKHIRDNVAKME
jgi:MarR family transcriptional regulator, transcriptional regulator for hemolysin